MSIPSFAASSSSLFLGNTTVNTHALSVAGTQRRRRRVSVSTSRDVANCSTPLTVKASSGRRRKASSNAEWRQMNSALVSEAKRNGAESMLRMFRQLLDSESETVVSQNFNQCISILVSSKRFSQAFNLATEAGERSLANIVTFRPLMKHCCAMGDGASAKKVWRLMSHYGVTGDMFVYAELMGALVRSQDLPSARKVITALTNTGIRPHIVLYNTLLKGYAKTADVRAAFDTLDQLESEGVNPDETTFNTLLNTCVRGKDSGALQNAMDRMRTAGIKPGVPTFNTLLKLYARSPSFDEALAIFNEMQETMEPSIVTFNTLIDGCAHRGDMEQAATFFDLMVSKGHNPDICTMTSLLKGFGRSNEPLRAVELFEAMEEGDFDIEDRTRYAVINACLRSGERKNAKQLMERMLKVDRFVCRPRTYYWMLECEINAHDQPAVCNTLSMMLDNRVRMDENSKVALRKRMVESDENFLNAIGMLERLR